MNLLSAPSSQVLREPSLSLGQEGAVGTCSAATFWGDTLPEGKSLPFEPWSPICGNAAFSQVPPRFHVCVCMCVCVCVC